ncbi:MAG TPA: response regulator transcription factor [Phycisphaerales bacterium]|nr:response regulator transcription factor [Phycisphaerales bacterium]
MSSETTGRTTVFFVDDHEDVRESVQRTLEDLDVEVACFDSADECVKALQSRRCDLLITDLRMPHMDGLELLRQAKAVCPLLPAIMVTGYGDVKVAVEAMRLGVVEFIEKPLSRRSLQSAVRSVLSHVSRNGHGAPVHALTDLERETLLMILQGRSNREIADIRRRSRRTVEDERRRIMQKLGAENLIDLVRIASAMGLPTSQ